MTGRIEKTVFISYRRTNLSWALAIYQNLNARGYDVFFDYESINSGDFEQMILGNIKARAHFLVLLTPSALERCDNPHDWLRREIETALDERRNIVPLFLEGFDFGSPSIAKHLTGKLTTLSKYNGLQVPSSYFFEAMERLHQRYLNIPLDKVLHPLSTVVVKAVQNQQASANKAKQVEQRELSAQEWYEQGKRLSADDNLEDAINAFEQATELDQNLTYAWENKVQLYIKLGQKKDASESISTLITLYKKKLEDAESQYDTSRDYWVSQAENDRIFGKQSSSMDDYYDNEVVASHVGYRQVDTEITNKIKALETLLSKLQISE